MEQFLHFIGSTPTLWKYIIPYLLMVIIEFSYGRYCYRYVKKFEWSELWDDCKHSLTGYIVCGVSFFILKLILNFVIDAIAGNEIFSTWVASNTFLSFLIWEGIFLTCFHLYIEFSDSDSKTSTSYTSTYIPSSSSTYSSRPTSRPSAPSQPSRPVQRTRKVPVPVPTPQKPKDPIGSVNMTDYENQVAKGIDIRLDFENNYSRIGKAVQLMKATGAKITFYNLDKIRSYDNLIHVAKLAPGQIIYERIFPADLAAIRLAESGACFKCDCKDRSTAIKDIAKAAKRGGGLVTFINISWMGSFELKELRELGGSHVEFK